MFKFNLRYPPLKIEEQRKLVLQSSYFTDLLADIQEVILVLNSARQLLFFNRDFQHEYRLAALDIHPGLRVGEVFRCINAEKGEHGCGSSKNCPFCSLYQQLYEQDPVEIITSDYDVETEAGATFSFQMRTVPFIIKQERFYFMTMLDISEAKTKYALERIFFHDIQNTANALLALSEVSASFDRMTLDNLIKEQTDKLVDELSSYKLMITAEKQELVLQLHEFDIKNLIEEIISSFQHYAEFSKISIKSTLASRRIRTDRTLLRRIVLNLLKNALEAAGSGQVEIKTLIDKEINQLVIKVYNKQPIPEEQQCNIFKKNFSTKGRGRGWGTYSVKQLTEHYLNGRVHFRSKEESGTCFTVEIPVELAE